MSLKKHLQDTLVKFQSGRLKNIELKLPAMMKGKNRVMVTLPEGIQTNSVLLRMVSELTTVFPSCEILVVVPIGSTEVARKTGLHALSPDLYSTNMIGLPKRGFFAKVKEFKATIYIDFETQKNVFNAMVSINSGAKLRVGVAGTWGNPIYNFQVKSKFVTDELKIYRTLVDVITQIQEPASGYELNLSGN